MTKNDEQKYIRYDIILAKGLNTFNKENFKRVIEFPFLNRMGHQGIIFLIYYSTRNQKRQIFIASTVYQVISMKHFFRFKGDHNQRARLYKIPNLKRSYYG